MAGDQQRMISDMITNCNRHKSKLHHISDVTGILYCNLRGKINFIQFSIREGEKGHYVSTEDPQRSNWVRFIRPAPNREDRNISLVTLNGELCFVTTADLSASEELLYWNDDTSSAWSKKRLCKSNCGGCNVRFDHPLYYRTHCQLFHDPNHSLTIRKYHCKVCGDTVLGKDNIMRHASQLHQGKGAYQCQYCDKFFLRLNYLEMHRTYGCAANPQRSRPLCDTCGRKFCQPQKLKVHIKRMHSDISDVLRDFQCKSCLRVLGSRAALQRHLKEVHHRDVTGSCNCTRCGKTFQNRSNLKIHMLTHSGIKPFRCTEKDCSAAFTTKQCLQFHYKKVHGFAEEAIPNIVRSVAFTFDAYSGEAGNSKWPTERSGSSKSPNERAGNSKPFNERAVDSKSPNERTSNSKSYERISNSRSSHERTSNSKSSHERTSNSKSSHERTSNSKSSNKRTGATAAPPTSHPNNQPLDSITEESMPLGPHPWEMRLQERQPDSDTSELLAAGKESRQDEHRGDGAFGSLESDGSHPDSPSPPAVLRSVLSKGSKKWLGEALEVAEEAAAALRLSPRSKREMYGLEDGGKSAYSTPDSTNRTEQTAFQDMQVDLAIGRSHIAPTTLPNFHPPESASLLVEAALDAAEKDIDMCVSSAKSPGDDTCYPQEQTSPPDLYYSPAPAATPVPSASHYSPYHLYADVAEQPPSPQRVYELQPSHHLHTHHDRVAHQSSDDEGRPMETDFAPCIAENLSVGMKDKTNSTMEMSPYRSYEPLTGTMGYEPQDTYSDSASPRYHTLYDAHEDRQTVDLSMAGRNGGPGCYSPYGESMRSPCVDLSIPRHPVAPSPDHGVILTPVHVQAISPPPYGDHGYVYATGFRPAAGLSYHYSGYY